MTTPSETIPAAEYARRIGIGKSGMSRLISRGLPFTEGQDDHGRLCKFIDPVLADAWRSTHLTPKLDGKTGLLRGSVDTTTSRRPSPPSHKPREPARPSPPASRQSVAGGDEDLETARRMRQLRAQREEDVSALARLKRLQAEGKLLDREAALEGHERFVGQLAVLLDRMPADQATLLADRVGCTEHEAYLALKDLAIRLRSDLATYAERERDRLGIEEDIPEVDAA